ncbi:MAG: hypothetical protein H0T73_11430 [Ardenticatenales bacterium]|nr:hypothetical protein [Ardenticatenales bacterium]
MPTISDNPPTAPEPVVPPEIMAPQPPAPAPESASPPPPATASRSPVAFVWSDVLWQGRGVPDGLRPGRLLRGYRLLEALGALRWREVEEISIDEALGSQASLQRFHQNEYIQAVSALGRGDASPWSTPAFGFTEEGAHAFPGMAELAALYVASARTAVQAVTSGRTSRAISLAGSQVHARAAQAQNSAIFNDVLLALLDARDAMKKVAFLNLDAEHPTVVQEHFYSDPYLLTLSLHEDPLFLYPGTGFVKEVGEGAGQGFNVNLPLPAGAGDDEYLWAFEQVMMPLLEQFSPDLIILLGGGSAHLEDPLAHLSLSSIGYQKLLGRISTLVPQIVLLGGAGMQLSVMARLWALALATLAGHVSALPPHLPTRYTKSWGSGSLHDEVPPRRRMTPLRDYVAQRVQETVAQAQQALFPLWKLPVPRANREFYDEIFVPFHLSAIPTAAVDLIADSPTELWDSAARVEEPVGGQGPHQKRSRPKGKRGRAEEPAKKEPTLAGPPKRQPEGGKPGAPDKKRRRKRSGQGSKGPQDISRKTEPHPKKKSGGEK